MMKDKKIKMVDPEKILLKYRNSCLLYAADRESSAKANLEFLLKKSINSGFSSFVLSYPLTAALFLGFSFCLIFMSMMPAQFTALLGWLL